jgi:hypothetical protein
MNVPRGTFCYQRQSALISKARQTVSPALYRGRENKLDI